MSQVVLWKLYCIVDSVLWSHIALLYVVIGLLETGTLKALAAAAVGTLDLERTYNSQ